MNFEFMTIDTPLPPCMPFPRALTGFPVSSTAKVMYCRMLDAMLSKGQEDENGILFVCNAFHQHDGFLQFFSLFSTLIEFLPAWRYHGKGSVLLPGIST